MSKKTKHKRKKFKAASEQVTKRQKKIIDDVRKAMGKLLTLVPGGRLVGAYHGAQRIVQLDVDTNAVAVEWTSPEDGPLLVVFALDPDSDAAIFRLESNKPLTRKKWELYKTAASILQAHAIVAEAHAENRAVFEQEIAYVTDIWSALVEDMRLEILDELLKHG